MRGACVLDRRGRFLWKSWDPGTIGATRGKPIWQWMDERSKAAIQGALCAVTFEGEPLSHAHCHVELNGDSFAFDCEVRPVPNAAFLVSWRRGPQKPVHLTQREKQVLLAECEDEPMKVTAKRLGISLKTVETHRANLRKKTGARGPATLARWAIANGLLDA